MNLSVGVLIIGSLFWCSARHRENWRKSRLNRKRGIRVKAPIRYGRLSEKRKTYTMVFSQGLSKSDMGWGIGIPCKKPVKSTEDLICEAEFLWAAEQSKCSKPGPISAKSWGCVGLLTNPDANACFSRKIRNAWSERVRRAKEEEEYPELPHATGECSIVSKDGILNIPWPTTEDGNLFEVDILLATANKPTFCDDQYKYAKPRQIAEAWNEEGDAEYFRKNRENCIITFEDDCIEKHLKRVQGSGRPG